MPEIANTPNTELGKVVVEALVSEGLILPEGRASVLEAICHGEMTLDGWRSVIEMKVLQDEGPVDDAKADQED